MASGCGSSAGAPREDAGTSSDVPMSSGGTVGTGGLQGSGGVTGAGGTRAGGTVGSGGAVGTGGIVAAGGAKQDAGAGDVTTSGDTGTSTTGRCDSASLLWKTGSKTNFTSYPDPGSVECVEYSGCLYEGLFAACPSQETKDWVSAHNIVSVFPDFNQLKLHDLCLKSGSNTIVVTVLDTCADSDCSGCCTQNQGSADELIDVESFTDARWGVDDGKIQWADLGSTTGSGCN